MATSKAVVVWAPPTSKGKTRVVLLEYPGSRLKLVEQYRRKVAGEDDSWVSGRRQLYVSRASLQGMLAALMGRRAP